jgi:hypothetical protein
MGEDETPDAHRPYEDMAVAHVLGGLDSDDGRLFRSHLLECSDCRARVGELRAIASDLAGVERDERRERSAKAVETKRRNDESVAEVEPPGRPGFSRWLVLGLAAVIVCLVAYTVVLRGNNERLQLAMDERVLTTAAMEHGEEMDVSFRAPGLTATVKVDGERLALLIEGMEDDTGYGVYLLDDATADGQTVHRRVLTPRDGRILEWLPLIGVEDRMVVTMPDGAVGSEPDGRQVLEVQVETQMPAPDSVGSA